MDPNAFPQSSPQSPPPGGHGASSGAGQRDTAVWLFVGCGLFLLLGLCVASGGLVYMALNQAPGAPGSPNPAGVSGGPPGVPTGPAVPTTGSPRRVQATVTQTMGASPVAVDGHCSVTVHRLAEAMPVANCHADVVCGGALIYGGPNAGYFPCEMSENPPSVRGQDDQTTASDQDAAMRIDTGEGILTVSDDAQGARGVYSLTARIDSVS